MTLRRLARIYDNYPRPETTGLCCRQELAPLIPVEHTLPADAIHVRRREYDAAIAIDYGLDYLLPTSIRPLVYWAIDTHLNYARSKQRAESCDLVFTAQLSGAEQLRADGESTATWLSLACDPDLHGHRKSH